MGRTQRYRPCMLGARRSRVSNEWLARKCLFSTRHQDRVDFARPTHSQKLLCLSKQQIEPLGRISRWDARVYVGVYVYCTKASIRTQMGVRRQLAACTVLDRTHQLLLAGGEDNAGRQSEGTVEGMLDGFLADTTRKRNVFAESVAYAFLHLLQNTRTTFKLA